MWEDNKWDEQKNKNKKVRVPELFAALPTKFRGESTSIYTMRAMFGYHSTQSLQTQKRKKSHRKAKTRKIIFSDLNRKCEEHFVCS